MAWYQARSRQAAGRFEPEVDQVLGSIAANPSIFPPYDDDNRFAMLRRFPFSIVYHVQGERIDVMGLAHLRRSPDYWQGRA